MRAREPRLVDVIVDLMSQHPDRGTFEVALGRTTGDARALRLFMEMARWPDDIRKGAYDHPTWHYASKPLIDTHHPPAVIPSNATSGSALEAFALNLSVARDPRAPASERAIALCWIFHLVGDIHQPLHAAEEYSTRYPDGDHGGGLQYVRDPQSQQPLSLHWYWDQAVTRSSEAAPERAAQLRRKLPRDALPELAKRSDTLDDFSGWMGESYALARTQVYQVDLATSADESQAPALSAVYVANSVSVAERRLTLSAYRLADLLIAVLRR
jgi:hypothetical protein